MSVCGYGHVSAVALESKRARAISLELELDCWELRKWVLGSELRSSVGAADVLKH